MICLDFVHSFPPLLSISFWYTPTPDMMQQRFVIPASVFRFLLMVCLVILVEYTSLKKELAQQNVDMNVSRTVTIIAPQKGISVTSLLYSIDIFFAFLKRKIHVAIDTLQFSCAALAQSQTLQT
jgi:hypothetical protein